MLIAYALTIEQISTLAKLCFRIASQWQVWRGIRTHTQVNALQQLYDTAPDVNLRLRAQMISLAH
jgi:hypothetical protein